MLLYLVYDHDSDIERDIVAIVTDPFRAVSIADNNCNRIVVYDLENETFVDAKQIANYRWDGEFWRTIQ